MRKTIATLAACSAVALGVATTTHAGSPTCSDMAIGDWDNHGQHVTEDYAKPANDGNGPAEGARRGGPAHRTSPPAPGASFCLDQANSPGMHGSDFD